MKDIIEEKIKGVGFNIANAENGIKARTNLREKLANQQRYLKEARRVLAQASLSTSVTDKSFRENKEVIRENEAVLSHLKNHLKRQKQELDIYQMALSTTNNG